MKRRVAREKIMQILFQIDFIHEDIEQGLTDMIEELENLEQQDRMFIKEMVLGTYQNLSVLDNEISKYLKGWNITRLAGVDKAIMRLAAYELMFKRDLSVNVVVNEAVELAKRYGADDSPKFINGVLGSMAKATSGTGEKEE